MQMQLKPNSAMLLRHQSLERETCEITNYCQSPFHIVNQKEHLTSSVSPKIFLLSECPRITHSHLMSLIISGLQINKYVQTNKQLSFWHVSLSNNILNTNFGTNSTLAERKMDTHSQHTVNSL